MANGVKVSVNYAGVGQLLKSKEMQDMLESRASEIKNRCGDGYETDTYIAGTRVIASVYTGDFDAMRDQKNNNTLLKALK